MARLARDQRYTAIRAGIRLAKYSMRLIYSNRGDKAEDIADALSARVSGRSQFARIQRKAYTRYLIGQERKLTERIERGKL